MGWKGVLEEDQNTSFGLGAFRKIILNWILHVGEGEWIRISRLDVAAISEQLRRHIVPSSAPRE
jgi:hypothetical protein